MDEERFQAAERAYALADYKTAAREYLAAVQGQPPEGTGKGHRATRRCEAKSMTIREVPPIYAT